MSEPLLVLDPAASEPPSEQIVKQLRHQIAAGRLPVGASLPSVRQLARDLGIAPNTVVRAYSELRRLGWVVASARRGIRVADIGTAALGARRQQEIEQAVGQLIVTARRLGVDGHELRLEIDRQLSG